MSMGSFPWRLVAALAGGALLGGCTSAAVQTPTLSYVDIHGRPVAHPDHLPADSPNGPWNGEISDSYGLLFSPRENTDRFGVANAYYLHPLPHNLKDYVPIAAQWRPSMKDPKKPDPAIWKDAEFRNFVQNDLLRRSDQICNAYQARLINGFIVGESIADSAGSLIKILAAPLEAMSATLAGAVNGASLQFSSEFLKWKTFQQAHKGIMYSRRNLRNLIRKSQELPAKDYSFSQAVYDAERYHSYCNITMAYVAGEEWIGKETNEQIIPTSERPQEGSEEKPTVKNGEPADESRSGKVSQEEANTKAP